jgi:hypothetical protein
MNQAETFREAVRRLHREKDAAYRNAWKKRGEVLSILANIARKVDRLEAVLDGAPTTQDESLMDTAVDLLVYCLKYQTYLADLDATAAQALLGARADAVASPYSDGPAGFDHLLARLDLGGLERADQTVRAAATQTIDCFGELEACFDGLTAPPSAMSRLAHAQALVGRTVALVGALNHHAPTQARAFLAAYLEGVADAS